MIEITDENFEKEIIGKSKEVLLVVDFWAEWCMPCLTLSPILEKLIKEYKCILIKVNIDKVPKRSEEYKIMSIPNVKIFKNEGVIDEFVGAIPENEVKKVLEKNCKLRN